MSREEILKRVYDCPQFDLVTKLPFNSVDKKVLLVCATEEEYESALKALCLLGLNYTVTDALYTKVISSEYRDVKFLVCRVGVSYLSAFNLYSAILTFEPNAVVNFGTCASLTPKVKLHDVVQSKVFANADMDMTAFGYTDGQFSKEDIVGDKPCMVSGSFFLSTEADKKKLRKRFPTAVSYDMESYMFDYVSKLCRTPFVSIRGVSDDGTEQPEGSYAENADFATIRSFILSLEVITRLRVSDL